MVKKSLCRGCIYRTRAAVAGRFCCGYLLYTGRSRLPQMDHERTGECPVMLPGDPKAWEIARALLFTQSRSMPAGKSETGAEE